MIDPRISAVWSTTKQIAPFSYTPGLQEVHTKAEVVHLYYLIVKHWKCIAKHIIDPGISAIRRTTKQIAPFCCTPSVIEVHTKAEVVHLTLGLLGSGVLFNWYPLEMYCEIYD